MAGPIALQFGADTPRRIEIIGPQHRTQLSPLGVAGKRCCLRDVGRRLLQQLLGERLAARSNLGRDSSNITTAAPHIQGAFQICRGQRLQSRFDRVFR